MVNSLSTNLAYQYRGLWITDALLAETPQRFSHSPRRYGSNVPGPLEARRRAAKRKNTNLAYAGSPAPPAYDPAVVLGSGSRDRWWKKFEDAPAKLGQLEGGAGTTNVQQNAPSLLPSWLFGDSERLPERKGREKRLPLTEASSNGAEDRVVTKETERVFKARISRTSSLKAIRNVLKQMRINLREHPNLSEVVFRHLLKINEGEGSHETLSLALKDPDLHPPGSKNHLLFVRHILQSRDPWKLWRDMPYPSLLKAIELGLVAPPDLEEIILLMAEIQHGMTTTQGGEEFHTEWHRLLDAIDQSRVLQLNDLDSDFLSLWYQKIAQSPSTETTYNLLWRLRQYSDLTEAELGGELIRSTMTQPNESEENLSERTIRWLNDLPAELRGPVIVQATFKMLSDSLHDGSQSVQVIEEWSAMLPQLYSEQLDFSVSESMWEQIGTVSERLAPPQQLMTAIWIATRLWADKPDAATQLASISLRKKFTKTFFDMTGVDELDHLSRVVLTLDTLPLPQKDQIFPFLQHFSSESLIRMLGNRANLEGLMACFRVEYTKLQDVFFVYNARHEFPEMLRALAETINSDLPRFKAMAQTMILKSSENFTIVRRLVENNMKMKFAASKSWPSLLARHKRQGTQTDLDPELVLDTLEKLTMTFAVTPVISPRSAFKHTHKMYILLHRIGAPINPIIARALWHAGVTRYGKTGASRSQVAWCLARVREIEGEEAANRLLWSAGYREGFVWDFVRTLPRSDLPAGLRCADDTVPKKI